MAVAMWYAVLDLNDKRWLYLGHDKRAAKAHERDGTTTITATSEDEVKQLAHDVIDGRNDSPGR